MPKLSYLDWLLLGELQAHEDNKNVVHYHVAAYNAFTFRNGDETLPIAIAQYFQGVFQYQDTHRQHNDIIVLGNSLEFGHDCHFGFYYSFDSS